MVTIILPGAPIFGTPDTDLWRGTDRPRPQWIFGLDLVPYEIELEVAWRGGGFTVATTDEPGGAYGALERLPVTDLDPDATPPDGDPDALSVLRWSHTEAAGRLMPLGRIARGRVFLNHKADGFRRLHREFYFNVR